MAVMVERLPLQPRVHSTDISGWREFHHPSISAAAAVLSRSRRSVGCKGAARLLASQPPPLVSRISQLPQHTDHGHERAHSLRPAAQQHAIAYTHLLEAHEHGAACEPTPPPLIRFESGG